jgi:hypothetical protein
VPLHLVLHLDEPLALEDLGVNATGKLWASQELISLRLQGTSNQLLQVLSVSLCGVFQELRKRSLELLLYYPTD